MFSNIQSNAFWTSTEFAGNFGYAWYFGFSNGIQLEYGKGGGMFAWAVRDCDVSTVPVPSATWLFASGLGLLSIRARQKL